MSHATKYALVTGEVPPAMSVSWDWPRDESDSGFVIFLADWDPASEGEIPSEMVCFDCVLELGGVQLGRGLDLARELRCSVDFDVDDGSWFVPADSVLAAGELVGS